MAVFVIDGGSIAGKPLQHGYRQDAGYGDGLVGNQGIPLVWLSAQNKQVKSKF